MLRQPHKGKSEKLRSTRSSAFSGDYDSDDSDSPIASISTLSTSQTFPLSAVDEKTFKRLNAIVSAQHLQSIIRFATSDPAGFSQIISYLFAITVAWPVDAISRRNRVISKLYFLCLKAMLFAAMTNNTRCGGSRPLTFF